MHASPRTGSLGSHLNRNAALAGSDEHLRVDEHSSVAHAVFYARILAAQLYVHHKRRAVYRLHQANSSLVNAFRGLWNVGVDLSALCRFREYPLRVLHLLCAPWDLDLGCQDKACIWGAPDKECLEARCSVPEMYMFLEMCPDSGVTRLAASVRRCGGRGGVHLDHVCV